MNEVLQEIFSTGHSTTPEGTLVPVHSNVDLQECKLLTHLIEKFNPKTSLEIGLAYGVSTLAICDSLAKIPESQHIVIDPHQNIKSVWGGIGLHNLHKAGFEKLIEFYEETSYCILPKLVAEDRKIDFAFIDGRHTFDYALVDFFYIDKLLRVGGIVIFDDADWPAIRKVCRFVAINLNYSVYNPPQEFQTKEHLSSGYQNNIRSILHKIKNALQRINPLVSSSDKPPSISSIDSDIGLGLKGSCIVFKKEAEDSRRWDHFVSF